MDTFKEIDGEGVIKIAFTEKNYYVLTGEGSVVADGFSWALAKRYDLVPDVAGYRIPCVKTGLALYMDLNCIPSFRHLPMSSSKPSTCT